MTAGSFKAVQDYQTKLLQTVQANAEANMQLAQKLMSIRLLQEMTKAECISTDHTSRLAKIAEERPSDFIETVS